MVARSILRHRAVVALRLPALVSEIFHGFVIEEAVDRLCARLRVRFDIFAPDCDPLFAKKEAEPGIKHDHYENDGHELPAEIKAEKQGTRTTTSRMVGIRFNTPMRMMRSMAILPRSSTRESPPVFRSR